MGLFGKGSKKKVFGISLEQAVKTSPLNDGLPLPVSRAIQRVEKKGMDLEGIYRISGTKNEVLALQKAYDSGQDPNLDTIDTFVVAGMMKKYFVELPDPLMTFALYDKFLAAARTKSKREKVVLLKGLVKQMPELNRQVLFLVMSHLRRVADKNDENKMGPNNLAIVFGPTLFRSTDENPVRVLTDSPSLLQCVQQFLLFFEYIFKDGSESVLDDLEPAGAPAASGTATGGVDKWEKMRNGRKASRRDRKSERFGHLQIEDEAELRKRGISISGAAQEMKQMQGEPEASSSAQVDNLLSPSPAPQGIEEHHEVEDDEQNDFESDSEDEGEDRLATTIEGIASKLGNVLLEVVLDVENPLENVVARLKTAREQDSRGEDIASYTRQELEDEKKLLRTELRNFEKLFVKHKDREPTKEDKAPLNILYQRYRDVKKKIATLEGKTVNEENEDEKLYTKQADTHVIQSNVKLTEAQQVSPASPQKQNKKGGCNIL